MTDRRRWRGGPHPSGALLFATVLLVSCAAGASVSSTTARRAEASGANSTEVAPSTTRAQVPGAAVLDTALQSLQAGYAFESTVSLDGQVVTSVVGRVAGGAVQATITTGDGELEYLVGLGGRWVRQPGEEWLVLSGEAPVLDVVDQLKAYQSVEVLEQAAGRTVLRAQYPPDVLGLDGSGPVTVDLTLSNEMLTRAAYASTVGDRPAEVVTTFSEVGSVTTITAPGG